MWASLTRVITKSNLMLKSKLKKVLLILFTLDK